MYVGLLLASLAASPILTDAPSGATKGGLSGSGLSTGSFTTPSASGPASPPDWEAELPDGEEPLHQPRTRPSSAPDAPLQPHRRPIVRPSSPEEPPASEAGGQELVQESVEPTIMGSPSSTVRTLGVAGESCRAALDCRPELRCRNRVCVVPPPTRTNSTLAGEVRTTAPARAATPRPSVLRVGLELGPGLGFVRAQRSSLLGPATELSDETVPFVADLMAFVELGVDRGQLLFAWAGGIGWPAGVEPSASPAGRFDFRADWRLWSDGPATFYIEPRLEGYAGGGLPKGLALGGSLGGRFRFGFFDVGLRVGGLSSLEGAVRLEGNFAVREQVSALYSSAFIALSPAIIAW